MNDGRFQRGLPGRLRLVMETDRFHEIGGKSPFLGKPESDFGMGGCQQFFFRIIEADAQLFSFAKDLFILRGY